MYIDNLKGERRKEEFIETTKDMEVLVEICGHSNAYYRVLALERGNLPEEAYIRAYLTEFVDEYYEDNEHYSIDDLFRYAKEAGKANKLFDMIMSINNEADINNTQLDLYDLKNVYFMENPKPKFSEDDVASKKYLEETNYYVLLDYIFRLDPNSSDYRNLAQNPCIKDVLAKWYLVYFLQANYDEIEDNKQFDLKELYLVLETLFIRDEDTLKFTIDYVADSGWHANEETWGFYFIILLFLKNKELANKMCATFLEYYEFMTKRRDIDFEEESCVYTVLICFYYNYFIDGNNKKKIKELTAENRKFFLEWLTIMPKLNKGISFDFWLDRINNSVYYSNLKSAVKEITKSYSIERLSEKCTRHANSLKERFE